MHLNNLIAVILLVGLTGCNLKPSYSAVSTPSPVATKGTSVSSTGSAPIATPSAAPDRLLTICLGREPASLFYYDAKSTAAQAVLAAIYDGPVDIQNYSVHAVILEKIPSLADGDSSIKTVEVATGDVIADTGGNPVTLQKGVTYRPSGCTETACSQAYPGDVPVQMDQWVVRYKLLPGLQWSDGNPLTSADSVYSYQVAKSLYPTAQADLIDRTESYQAVDEYTVDWTGIPGYLDGLYQDKFFTPLPQHAWKDYSAEDLRAAEQVIQKPVGWGPYVLDEWVSGDHISLHKNPLYFRSGESLPHFDHLVFRFVNPGSEAVDALLAGECDLVDQTAVLETQSQRLSELQQNGKLQTFYLKDAAWEQVVFGISPLDPQRQQFFASTEVRQAVAMCIDRQALADSHPMDGQVLTDSYTSPTNPLYNPENHAYEVDLQKAADLLVSAGWLDPDNDPGTPRVAQGVSGVADGTPFEVEYLVSPDGQEQADALAIQAMLQKCGLSARVITREPQDYLAAGPDGPVFGRSFDMAQFAFSGVFEPPCSLYMSSEIPGPYPEFPKGWGGVNASGYANPQFDQACQGALYSLPDTAQHQADHFKAQELFSTDVPALPLYVRSNVLAARPDLCNFSYFSAIDSVLWSLEEIDVNDSCSH